jgi:nicotinate-nucleotide adenylyltransferase
MRLGIFGGTFDPVHDGHLLLAETCREACRLDEVWFVPAALPPHKQERRLSPAKDRIEMLRLAVAGFEAYLVSTIEIERGGVSYTVSTLEAVQALRPEATLFFPMGADSLADLPTWREPRRICELSIPVIVRRAGSPEPDLAALAALVTPERLEEIRAWQVQMPVIELSSTDIRRRVAAGHSIRFRTPRAVEKYIETHGLYRTEA